MNQVRGMDYSQDSWSKDFARQLKVETFLDLDPKKTNQ